MTNAVANGRRGLRRAEDLTPGSWVHGTVQTSEMWCAVYMCLSQGPLLSVHSASLSRIISSVVSVLVHIFIVHILHNGLLKWSAHFGLHFNRG